MPSNHSEGPSENQASVTTVVDHSKVPRKPNLSNPSQGFLYGRHAMAITQGRQPTAPSHTSRDGFRPSSQCPPASMHAPQTFATSHWQRNAPQTYQDTQSASDRILVPDDRSRRRLYQQPRQDQRRGNVPQYCGPQSFQGFQNEHSNNHDANGPLMNDIYHSDMAQRLSSSYIPPQNGYQPNAESLAERGPNFATPPNGYHSYAQSMPRPEGPNFRGGKPPERKYESFGHGQNEQYRNVQKSDSAHVDIVPGPAVSPDAREAGPLHYISEARSMQQNRIDVHQVVATPAPTTTPIPAPIQSNIPDPDLKKSRQPRQTSSEAEGSVIRDSAIQEAADQVLVLFPTEESPKESSPPQLPNRLARQEAELPLTSPRCDWNDPEHVPTRSQDVANDVPEDPPKPQPTGLDQSLDRATSSSQSNQSPASTKRRRGRPTKEEQRKKDLENPEGARLRAEKRAVKKAEKEAAKQRSGQEKEKKKGDPVKHGSSTRDTSGSKKQFGAPEGRPALDLKSKEEEELYSADADKLNAASGSAQPGRSMTRKRAATTHLESLNKQQKTTSGQKISNAEHDRAQSEGAVPMSSNGKRSNDQTSVRGPWNPVRQPEGSSNVSQSRIQRRGSSSDRSRSTHLVDDRHQTGSPRSVEDSLDVEDLNDDAAPIAHNNDDNEQQDPPVIVLPLHIWGRRNRILAYFGRKYCRQYDIREIVRCRIYHSSAQVHEIPGIITHFLSCSRTIKVQPQRATLPKQAELCVIPNEFGSFSNVQFMRIIDFIYQANEANRKLLIACSSENAFESAVIEGLVVVASVLVEKKTNLRERNTLAKLDYLRMEYPEWNLQPSIELLDDFDFFLQWGQGSDRWNGATNQWKEFVDAIGNTNKRRRAGHDLEYIEVRDFKPILSATPVEPTAIELELPVPFNKRTLAKQVLDWWETQDSEDIPWNFSRTKLQLLFQTERPRPEREAWPVGDVDDEDEAYEEAIDDEESWDTICDWALVM